MMIILFMLVLRHPSFYNHSTNFMALLPVSPFVYSKVVIIYFTATSCYVAHIDGRLQKFSS